MKEIFLLLYLSLNVFAFDEIKVELESIAKHALIVGHGKEFISYVFVDPICPFSREFITEIMSNKELQKTTTYHVFLYRLPKYETDRLIRHIYASKKPLVMLKKVMVDEQEIYFDKTSLKTIPFVNTIAEVGKKIKVGVRPYLIKYKKGSNYCDVSHGTAPCEQVDCPHG